MTHVTLATPKKWSGDELFLETFFRRFLRILPGAPTEFDCKFELTDAYGAFAVIDCTPAEFRSVFASAAATMAPALESRGNDDPISALYKLSSEERIKNSAIQRIVDEYFVEKGSRK